MRAPRRRILLGGVALAVTAALLPSGTAAASPSAAAPPGAGKHWHRAVSAYDGMQRAFYDRGAGLYRETAPPDPKGNPYSYVWPYSQAMIGTLDLAGVPGRGRAYRAATAKRFANLAPYWNATTTPKGYDSYLRPPLGQGGDKFYDDNEWIGLALVQRYHDTGDEAALRRAEQIFRLVDFGWDDDPSHPCPGGTFWTQAPWSQDRNTVSNGPGAELGAHLYLLTGKRAYLSKAKRMYVWTRGCLLAPNGLYWDHIDLKGTIEKTQWSYNQGVMLGAGVLLYRATHDRTYLRQARSTARAALSFYGTDDGFMKQPSEFNAIFFGNLLQLNAVRHDAAYRRTMAAYADEAYAKVRDPATGLYRFDGDDPVTLLHQAGMVRIESMLAWPRSRYRLLT